MTKFLNLAVCCLLTALCAISINCTQAQNAPSAADEAAVLKTWSDVWASYESGDEAKMWAFYAENATEIYPDGTSMTGKSAIKAGYDQFKDMLEGKPSWSMGKPSIQFLGSDVAILTSDVDSDIKLKGGMQVGGKSKFAVVLHKEKGQWLIAFDSQTPVLPPPAMPDAAGKN